MCRCALLHDLKALEPSVSFFQGNQPTKTFHYNEEKSGVVPCYTNNISKGCAWWGFE